MSARKKKVPQQRPGHSEQTVVTPDDFREAVVMRFGAPTFDLAASADNYFSKEGDYWGMVDNSLNKDWVSTFLLPMNVLWLNPPYENIKVWAEKCAHYAQNAFGKILFLVPASVGSKWFAEHVEGKAQVLALRPRIQFVGHETPYPKDLVLCVYCCGLSGFQTWKWKEE